MSLFLGTYRNLAREHIGKFTVIELAGRDSSGAPCWRVICDTCSYPQTLPHSKLAPLVEGKDTQQSLMCQNPACDFSRVHHTEMTVADIRREEAAEAAALLEQERAAAAKAHVALLNATRNYELHKTYCQLWNHQYRNGVSTDQICTKQRWFGLGDANRALVIAAMVANPDKRLNF